MPFRKSCQRFSVMKVFRKLSASLWKNTVPSPLSVVRTASATPVSKCGSENSMLLERSSVTVIAAAPRSNLLLCTAASTAEKAMSSSFSAYPLAAQKRVRRSISYPTMALSFT